MQLCSYGCGQEGKFPLQNGKICCSSHFTKCPELIKKFQSGKHQTFKHCFKCDKSICESLFNYHVRTCIIKKCLECKKQLTGDYRNKFCSHTCAGYYNNRKNGGSLRKNYRSLRKNDRKREKIYNCLNCNQKFKNPKKYCNFKCQVDYKYKNDIIPWLSGIDNGIRGTSTASFIKRYIKKRDGEKCCQCGWAVIHSITNTIPIQLDHIDGNWKNNNPNNLRLLCPNCHTLTETYGSLNRGNGRG